jgi:hypothetical protein
LPCCSAKKNGDSLKAWSWKSSKNGSGTALPVTETLAQKDDGEGTVRAKRVGVGCVGGFTEGGVGFYRVEARWGRAKHLELPA